jgi:GNAT superfamily N-acetyltransferase
MNTVDLSLKMKRLTQWLDGQRPPARFIRKRFDGSPFGNCYVTIDPDRQARFASGNMNRVHLCGAEPGMDSDSIRRIVDLFAAEGIERFFVWLSPGPEMEAVRGWLGRADLRACNGPAIRRYAAVSVRPFSSAPTIWPDYVRTAGCEGFFHYMAFDGKRPVAIAALCMFEDIGYLMAAATAESHRRRGAQQALIAKRIERADALGCAIEISETLYMLEHSWRNLQRAGFQEVYEKEVYEWSA